MRGGLAAAAGVAVGVVAVAALVWVSSRSTTAPTSHAAPRPSAQVVGRATLAPDAPSPPEAATLVVYAYALDGPRLPLAVLQRGDATLPMDFKLDDALAPNPAYRLSQAVQVVVGARLGQGEGVAARPGDWLAVPQTVPLGTHGIQLVLRPPAAASPVPAR